MVEPSDPDDVSGSGPVVGRLRSLGTDSEASVSDSDESSFKWRDGEYRLCRRAREPLRGPDDRDGRVKERVVDSDGRDKE